MEKRFPFPYSDPRWWWEADYHMICFECVHFVGKIKGELRCKLLTDPISRDYLLRENKDRHPCVDKGPDQFERWRSSLEI